MLRKQKLTIKIMVVWWCLVYTVVAKIILLGANIWVRGLNLILQKYSYCTKISYRKQNRIVVRLDFLFN